MLSYSLLLQLVRAMSKKNPNLLLEHMPVLHKNNLGDSYIVGIAVKHHGFAILPDGLLIPHQYHNPLMLLVTNNADSLARIYSFKSKQAQ